MNSYRGGPERVELRTLKDNADPCPPVHYLSEAPIASLLKPRAFCVRSRLLLLAVHTLRASKRAQKFSHNFARLHGATRAPARLSPRRVLTLALADSHRRRRLHHLLSLPLALRGPGGGLRRPQGQDCQEQQPRRPEHPETERERRSHRERQVATKFGSLRNLRKESLPMPPAGCRLQEGRDQREWGRGRTEGQKERRGREGGGCRSPLRRSRLGPPVLPLTAQPARAAEPRAPGLIWDGPLPPPARPRAPGRRDQPGRPLLAAAAADRARIGPGCG